MLPLGEDEATRRTQSWGELSDMSIAADEGGLDSVWGADHLLFRDGEEVTGIHECWTVLTAVAAVTKRVEIGPLVLAMPFRNPAMVAKQAATFDEVSGGRLILGLGCGWHEPEFTAYDFPFDHRVGRFEEAVQITVPLLRDGHVTFEGTYHRADAELTPPSPRPGGPPIMIAGRQPRMMRIVAQWADQWNAAWFGMPEQATALAERIADQRAACELVGRDPLTLTLTAGIFVDFPHLASGGKEEEPPERAIRGDSDHVAEALNGYAQHGVEHVIAHVWPRTARAVEELARAAAMAESTPVGAETLG